MVVEMDLTTIKQRAVKGVAALTGKTFILQIVSFFGFFLLTIFLGKEEIGLFFAVSELVAILGYFSDIGLAAALIQKKEKPKLADIRSTFTIQQILVLTLVALVFISTPWLRNFYQIPSSGIWLLWSLTIGFFLASLKTIPSVILERKLRFDLLVVVEIVENLLFYGIAVLFAWKGIGILSYAWAVLARGIAGVILIYLFSPWKVGFAFEKDSLKHLLKFGIPYQANSLLAVVKDRMMNVFLWKIVGAGGVGILGWAQKWAQMPLRFVMDPVMKVTFPAFSRIQEKKQQLRNAVEFSLFCITALSFPLLTGIAILAKPLIEIIPKYQKWEVALIPLYLFCFNSIWGAVTTPLTNAFNAVGKIKLTFKLMILWTVLTWVFTPLLALKFGYLGAAWALGLIPISSTIVFYLSWRDFGINIIKPIFPSFLSSSIMGLYLVAFLARFSGRSLPLLAALIVSGGFVYLVSLSILAKNNSIKAANLLKNAFNR